ncbi:putative T-box transcription factor TBX22 [Daphnia magna]|uniref:Putative T-box transcription factor TBX22 n=1 Tax=Daphnia magna TaxID=35525 RepID=A0A164ZFB4_9CRUS|nr:putative T-box transcription factor TBX22 [Daphnia magna]
MSFDQARSSDLSARAKAFSVSSLIGAPLGSCDDSSDADASKHQPSVRLLDGDKDDDKFIPNQSIVGELLCRELWLEFHTLGTEMIITKAGRRMFPSLKVRLSGLDDEVLYIVYVEMDLVDDKRYRYIYQSSKWVPGGPGDVPHQERCFLHPDGPQLGKFWNKQSCVAFDKLKLTNNRKPSQRDQIPLHSMHRYQPKLYVQPIPSDCREAFNTCSDWWRTFCRRRSSATSLTFPETQFITVTAYQNQQITRLKIASNPFAKGFRESSREPRNSDVKEDDRAQSGSKKIRISSSSKDSNTSNFPLANSWHPFDHRAVHQPIHHWWIQQYSILHPFLPIVPSLPHVQTEEALQHCFFSDSTFV